MNAESILSKYDNKSWSSNEPQILSEILANSPDYQLVELPPDTTIKDEDEIGSRWFSTAKKVLKSKTAKKTANGVATFEVYYLNDDRTGEHWVKLYKGFVYEKQPEIKVAAAKPNNTKKYLIIGGIGLAAVIALVALIRR